jgi:hypothetical protein
VKRLLAPLLVVTVLAAWKAGSVQGAGQAVVRVTIDAGGPELIGHPVTVRVQVLVPNFFMSGLEFPTINIPGAIVARPGDAAEHLNETIGGESYAGIAQSFVITPQQAGEFTLPPAKITYRKDPVLSDETKDRIGSIGGHRPDQVPYLFEKPDDYALPALEIGWLNPATGKSEVARAPEIGVRVAPNPAFVPALAPEPPPATDVPVSRAARLDWKRWGSWVAGAVAGWLIAGRLLRRYQPHYLAWRQARRHAREESEPAYFARVARACRANDAPGAYRALGAWARRADAKTIAAWCADLGDPGLRRQLDALEQRLFARTASGSWDGHGFADVVTRARRAWLSRRATAKERPPRRPALKP